MENYLASRIAVGALDYTAVITKYPQAKVGINVWLTERGYSNLIVVTEE